MSVSCLKKTVGFFAFIIACAGIAIIVVTSILLHNSSANQLWSQAGINFGTALTIGVLVLGILLFLLGIQGIYGGCKKSKCCLSFYQLGIFLICACCIGAGVCASIYFAEYSDDVQDQVEINEQYCGYDFLVKNPAGVPICNNMCGKAASSLSSFNSLNQKVNALGNYFGHNPNCQIYASSQTVQDQIENYGLEQTPFQITNVEKNGYIAVQGCKSTANSTIQQYINEVSSFMTFLETSFQCSGMCQPYSYYVFTNVNQSPQGVQKKPCFNAFQKFLNDYSLQIQLVAYITGSVLFINVIMVFVLCCKKENKGGNIYTRMDYLDD